MVYLMISPDHWQLYAEQINEHSSLPPGCYTDPGFLGHELDRVFSTEWLCVGRLDQIPNTGDFFTLEIVGEPLIVVRSDDDRIRILSNVCRHRSMQVASGSGNRRLFVCPYHAWSYKNDGSLQVAPLMEKSQLEANKCSLPEFSCEIWKGFIFVSFEAQADTNFFAEKLSELEPIIENYHGEQMHLFYQAEEIWPCNWKSLVENFMEGYHLSTVHPITLGNSTPTNLCEKLPGNDCFTAYRAHYPDSAVPRQYWHPDTTEEERHCSTLFSIFPGLVVSQSPDVLAWLAITPEGNDQVKVRWGLATIADAMTDSEQQTIIEKWRAINSEDQAKLEQVHRGLHSRTAAPGPLAPANYEGTISDFYRFLANRLAP